MSRLLSDSLVPGDCSAAGRVAGQHGNISSTLTHSAAAAAAATCGLVPGRKLF